MPIVKFPPASKATKNGLLALGGDLQVPSLLLAYSQGIFPWPHDPDGPMAWYSPDPRGLLRVENIRIPKKLKKILGQNIFTVTINAEFEKVIRTCANIRNQRGEETWITEEIIQAYIDMHVANYAYSVEVYQNNQLVGGLYGVTIGKFFSGESMFYQVSNASKIALISILAILSDFNIEFLDTQMVTPVVGSLGAEEVSRDVFLKKIRPLFNLPQINLSEIKINQTSKLVQVFERL